MGPDTYERIWMFGASMAGFAIVALLGGTFLDASVTALGCAAVPHVLSRK